MNDVLSNKTALVTGGRQGIGRAIVEEFANAGAKVMTCGRGPRPEGLQADVLWQQTDVASRDDVESLKKSVNSEMGPLAILVNNAGIQLEKTVVDTTDDDWNEVMGVNARGVFMLCRAFVPDMVNGGSIINIGSIAGDIGEYGLGLYNASKAFVHGLTRSIAVDHGPGVRCNAISPGWIMTAMSDTAFEAAGDVEAAKSDALARHPAGRFGQPEDVASLAVWLASDASSFVTGQCYTIDGGLTAASPLNPGFF
jgi:NAD(P)-dependent dehydrogenase (short-subunit alcohol dehydrogenase family)